MPLQAGKRPLTTFGAREATQRTGGSMSTVTSRSTTAQTPEPSTVEMKLEVVTLPVTDVDRAKSFYTSLGWRLDADIAQGDAFRVVQLTPLQSACSVAFGKGL